ncbi:F-box protein PP2-B10-like isoform X2 [Zingiber officinale]|uniref:F-box protein PP2-B10-like isoform X2 n=1 Tax=Zingiber officinale TaxID=94328 RepID=UPI001C4CD442|nr:F-box protein PP2-B10-like isoform X2 [Zingiber officinale]
MGIRGQPTRRAGNRGASRGMHRPRHLPHVAPRRLLLHRRLHRLPVRRRFRHRLEQLPTLRSGVHPRQSRPSGGLLLQEGALLPAVRQTDPPRRRQDGCVLQIFSLDRSSGAKCFMLSARELVITWADTDSYWRWVPEPDSRFSEVAELLSVCWLEIRGHFKCKMLSSKTTYAAYLIFKLSDRAYGLGHPLQEASVELGTELSTSVVCLQPSDMYAHMHARRSRVWFRRGLHWRRRVLTVNESQEADEEAKEAAGRVPQLRNDGWMEIELGEFYNCGEEDKEVDVSLLEVKGGHWKIGLIIEGIEIRPKK